MRSISAFNSFGNSITTSIQTIAKGVGRRVGGGLGAEANLHHTPLSSSCAGSRGPAGRVGGAAGPRDGKQVLPVRATRLH